MAHDVMTSTRSHQGTGIGQGQDRHTPTLRAGPRGLESQSGPWSAAADRLLFLSLVPTRETRRTALAPHQRGEKYVIRATHVLTPGQTCVVVSFQRDWTGYPDVQARPCTAPSSPGSFLVQPFRGCTLTMFVAFNSLMT